MKVTYKTCYSFDVHKSLLPPVAVNLLIQKKCFSTFNNSFLEFKHRLLNNAMNFAWNLRVIKDAVIESIEGYQMTDSPKYRMHFIRAHMDYITAEINDADREIVIY